MIAQVALAVAAAIASLFAFGYLIVVSRRQRYDEHLRRRLGANDERRSLLRAEKEEGSALGRLLIESGLGWSMSILTTRIVAATVLGAFAGWVFAGPALGVMCAGIGAVVFPLLVKRARDKRLTLCDTQMPQALEIAAMAMRAGHPLPAALAIAAAEAPSPIADELRRACEEHDLGRPIGDVLVNLGRRLPSSESVQTFVTAVLVLQQTGGNLISVIDRIVENARARTQYRQKLRALTAEGRSSANMLSVLPLVFGGIAAAADPGYAETLLGTTAGYIILGVTGTLWLMGIVWTRRLVRTEA